jgi:Protein of unknown function (DUF4242)
MASRADAESHETYLVEHYRPGLTVEAFTEWVVQLRETAVVMDREGKAVRYVRSAIVPKDESLLCVLEAATEELVRELYARAGIPFERLSTVIPEGGRGWAPSSNDAQKEGT